MSTILVTEWKKRTDESFMMVPVSVIQHALETDNMDTTIPPFRYDREILSDYDASRAMMTGKISLAEGMVGVTRIVAPDNSRMFFLLVFATLELYNAFKAEVDAEGLMELYIQTREKVAELFGLDVTIHEPINVPDEIDYLQITEEQLIGYLYT